MTNARELRVKAFNNWPAETVFPVQQSYIELLASKNVQTPIVHCNLQSVDDKEFHLLIAHTLDGLDALPKRPDWAFEAFYIPLEMEMNRLKAASGQHNASRFAEYKAFLSNQDSALISALDRFVSLAPLQVCEFAAKRIFQAQSGGTKNDKTTIQRAKDAIGTDLLEAFCAKYLPGSTSPDKTIRSANQRKAGGLIKLIANAKPISINGVSFVTNPEDRIAILSSVILPIMRNDRFHGNVFPSFRSSAYQLKHYAGSQFSATSAFLLVMLSIVSRWPQSISADELKVTIEQNCVLFERIFEKQIDK